MIAQRGGPPDLIADTGGQKPRSHDRGYFLAALRASPPPPRSQIPNPKSKIQNVIPRTFSLASLFLGITAFCALCGLAVNYPLESMAFIALPFLFFFPPCFCFVLSRFSPRPQVGLVAS